MAPRLEMRTSIRQLVLLRYFALCLGFLGGAALVYLLFRGPAVDEVKHLSLATVVFLAGAMMLDHIIKLYRHVATLEDKLNERDIED